MTNRGNHGIQLMVVIGLGIDLLQSCCQNMSSLDEKTREIIDAAERGEIVIGSGAVETIASDDGKITHTTRRICTPCANGKHGECDFMCDCNHPSHDRSSSEP